MRPLPSSEVALSPISPIGSSSTVTSLYVVSISAIRSGAEGVAEASLQEKRRASGSKSTGVAPSKSVEPAARAAPAS